MKRSKKCGECGGSKIRMTRVSAGGGYAPDLLPGAHSWWKSGKLEIYVCCKCGHLQYFVPDDAIGAVVKSKSFSDVT
jgi:hypothetical protein